MRAKLRKEDRDELIRQLRTYIADNFDEEVGDLKAGLLLDFLLERVGPPIYNQAIRHAGAFMSEKVLDMEAELHEDERKRK